MGLMIDTCIFISAEKENKSLNFNQWLEYGNACISAITASELLVGVYRADNEKKKVRRSAFVEAILSGLPILNFTLETARIHAEISTYLIKQGRVIGAHDLLIAATALSHGCALLTHNQNEFKRVPGLRILG